MPRAGWCIQCESYSWLAEDGSCVKGHDVSQISQVYEAQPSRDRLEEALELAESAAERAGEAIKQAWDEAKPSLVQAGSTAERAAEELGEGLKRFSEVIADRKPKASDPGPPPPSAEE